jgi:hypothetical protein
MENWRQVESQQHNKMQELQLLPKEQHPNAPEVRGEGRDV